MNREAEKAFAKINLALHVTGKRADGYHELDSLVVFAAVSDLVSATAADKLSLIIEGSGASILQAEPDNSVLAAARALQAYAIANDLSCDCAGANLLLDKHLPVEAGIGGGSADAAATLRALNRLWKLELPRTVLEHIGSKLGADVAVCVGKQACRMRGIGEQLEPLPAGLMPRLDLVLVNPQLPVATPAVFHALESPCQSALPSFPTGTDLSSWLTWLDQTRSDLFEPACQLCPEIRVVLSELDRSGAQMSRMSGSGATCFGIFADQTAAEQAARLLQEAHPDWWVCATRTI